jgi:hypothetical protein
MGMTVSEFGTGWHVRSVRGRGVWPNVIRMLPEPLSDGCSGLLREDSIVWADPGGVLVASGDYAATSDRLRCCSIFLGWYEAM